MDILEKIVGEKRKEVEQRKKKHSIEQLLNSGPFGKEKSRSLKQTLLEESGSGIIAEFKRKSPSKGWFKPAELRVEQVVPHYDRHGAAGISVLTDEEFFGGSLNDLVETRRLTGIPLLRKDFMIDEWQLAEAKAYGADVILLIAACLSPKEVRKLAGVAGGYGLEVLLEIHNREELDHVCDEVDMVGVNNRNLKNFVVDINTSLQLIEQIPADKPAVAESGISNNETIVSLRKAGFKGFLIGENFMKENDPGKAFAEFTSKMKVVE